MPRARAGNSRLGVEYCTPGRVGFAQLETEITVSPGRANIVHLPERPAGPTPPAGPAG
ncbi:hypothetical protein ABZ766_10810 [Streptomyces sp. NPDC006670]|uniref:hypothetical protein n=1 Tax=Streptomyces sp. NPDC006670 TaxID=3154476 RepID=UPI0033E13BE0